MEQADKYLEQGDYTNALDLYVTFQKSGDTTCAKIIGWMYLSAKGTERNLDLARKYYLSYFNSTDVEVIIPLAQIERAQGNYAESKKYLLKGHNLGYMICTYRLGKLYKFGIGEPRDISKAKHYFEIARSKGHIPSRLEIHKITFLDSNVFVKVIIFFKMLYTILILIRIAYKNNEDPKLEL